MFPFISRQLQLQHLVGLVELLVLLEITRKSTQEMRYILWGRYKHENTDDEVRVYLAQGVCPRYHILG